MRRASLNHAYRLVWNTTRHCWVAVAETTRARGKSGGRAAGAVLAAVGALASPFAQAACTDVLSDQLVTTAVDCMNVQGAWGVTIEAGGSVTTSGIIGINFLNHSAPGGVDNRGMITGSSNGITVFQSSVGTLQNSGTISTINNGTGQGILLTNSATVVGSVINSGVIGLTDTYVGVEGWAGSNSITGGLTNSGTIGGQVASIRFATTDIAGAFVNANGGKLLQSASFQNSDIIGGITNAGEITSSNNNGLQLSSGTFGGLINTGKITTTSNNATHMGVKVTNSTFTGGITNSGSITGNRALYLGFSTTVQGDVKNNVVLNGGITLITSSTIAGKITNSGRIAQGVEVDASTIASGIANTGLIDRNDSTAALYIHNAGSVGALVNQGTISSMNANAISIDAGTLTGIVNTGLIDSVAHSAAIDIRGGGSIAGLIDNDGGTIVGGINALNSVLGGISNTGAITVRNGSNDKAINIDSSTLHGAITNGAGGTIYGEQEGIYIYSGSIAGGIINQGSLASADASALRIQSSTLDNGIENTGIITATARSAVQLNNTYIGGDLFNSGTIAGSNGVEVGGTTIDGDVTNSGTMQGNGFGMGLYISSSATVNGAVVNSGTLSGGAQSLLIAAGASVTGGVLITGNDTARFNGIVSAPTTPIEIDSGATYSARGGEHFETPTFTNDGTFRLAATAASTPTATITGDFTNHGTLKVGVADTTHYGQLHVGGTATLDGTLLIDVASAASIDASALTSILQAGSISGKFSNYSDNSVLFDLAPVYAAANIGLSVAATSVTPPPTPSPTPTPAPVASLVEQIVAERNNAVALPAARVLGQTFTDDPTGALSSQFLKFTTENQVNTAVSETLPLLTGAAQAASRQAIDDIRQVILARLQHEPSDVAAKGISSGDETARDKGVWLKPFGSWADQDDRSGAPGYDADVTGVVLGLDGDIDTNTRLGVSLAYARADIDSKADADSNADIDIFQLIGYGSYDLAQDIQVDFHAGGGVNRSEGRRALPSFGVVAKSDYDSVSASAGAGISRVYALDEKLSFTPSVRADYTWIKDDDYAEKDAGALGLDVNGRTGDAFVVALDGRWNYRFQPDTSASLNLGVGYDLVNERYSLTSTYAGAPGAAFRTEGIDPSPVSLRGGIGLSHNVADNTEVSLRYDVEHRTDFLEQTASLKVRWAF